MVRGVQGRVDPLEDGRMWRLLLARLHPDAGGDPDLFLFASTLREEARAAEARGTAPVPDTFLEAWRGAMHVWASRNRETLGSFRLSEHSSISAKD